MESPQTFAEEIEFKEIELDKVVGKGTFGLVRKGTWRGRDCAVKIIETEQEKRAFFIEVRQLSRVNHPNIVKLYGACTRSPVVCLVMEYAEGGSLYNVLHCSPKVQYTAAHAISWVYQCAKGVAYLHNMRPRALIHRDLKPPNLLLIMGGTVLKICDFGTACDMQTVMTNNKGSAAWMAPEVFESSNYSEKCDIFSWGIILWEVLTRRKPFDEIGGPAFRIMWAVHSGQRPPLIEGCPKPLERLMTRCWSKEPNERPPMSEVEEHLSHLFEYFKEGADVPIINPSFDEYGTIDEDSLESTNQTEDLSQPELSSNTQQGSSTESSKKDCLPHTPSIVPSRPSRTSAPASLSSSKEHLEDSAKQRQNIIDLNKRKSADFSELRPSNTFGHHRTGSYGSSSVLESLNNTPIQLTRSSNNHIAQQSPTTARDPIHTEVEIPAITRKASWPPSIGSTHGSDTDLSDWNAYVLLEPKLQPLPPVGSSKDSMEIYDLHRRAANEYLHVQTEIRLLTQRKKELEEELKEDQQKTSTYIEEYLHLRSEKDSLAKLRDNLKKQIEVIKNEKQNRQRSASANNEDWVIVPKVVQN